MNFLSLIEAKRDGQRIPEDALRQIIQSVTPGEIPDYQMAAFLMAVFFRGLDTDETRTLTLAMRDSGDVLRFPADPRPVVDKHSTGGIGDKVSLPLAPLLACLGFRVPMISGRGLGITGGTLDKLESIPGYRTALNAEQIIAQVQDIGCVICGQTDRMVPADKALYALRDVTGTVPSIPLITASILSKKLAEGLDALVLDVKFGCAAFMQTTEQARALANSMVTLGNECGVRTEALLTDMNTPLGDAAGNWLEVKESVACLEGQGPADLRQLVIEFAAQLLVLTGRAANLESARGSAATCLSSGAPGRKWDEMLVRQGADPEATRRKLGLDHTAPVVTELRAQHAGFVTRCDARLVGLVIRDLGGGRITKNSRLNLEVGLDRLAKPGAEVKAGDLLCRVHAATPEAAAEACHRLSAAFEIGHHPPLAAPLILRG